MPSYIASTSTYFKLLSCLHAHSNGSHSIVISTLWCRSSSSPSMRMDTILWKNQVNSIKLGSARAQTFALFFSLKVKRNYCVYTGCERCRRGENSLLFLAIQVEAASICSVLYAGGGIFLYHKHRSSSSSKKGFFSNKLLTLFNRQAFTDLIGIGSANLLLRCAQYASRKSHSLTTHTYRILPLALPICRCGLFTAV